MVRFGQAPPRTSTLRHVTDKLHSRQLLELLSTIQIISRLHCYLRRADISLLSLPHICRSNRSIHGLHSLCVHPTTHPLLFTLFEPHLLLQVLNRLMIASVGQRPLLPLDSLVLSRSLLLSESILRTISVLVPATGQKGNGQRRTKLLALSKSSFPPLKNMFVLMNHVYDDAKSL